MSHLQTPSPAFGKVEDGNGTAIGGRIKAARQGKFRPAFRFEP